MSVIRQSGAIVIRRDAKEPQVLLVTAKRNPRNWIFPKGKIEAGETPEAAALREVAEEAGVVGKLVGPVGVLEYRFMGVKARVEYFLAELARDTGKPEDGRQKEWCGLDLALERLSYKNTRKLLRKAWKQVES